MPVIERITISSDKNSNDDIKDNDNYGHSYEGAPCEVAMEAMSTLPFDDKIHGKKHGLFAGLPRGVSWVVVKIRVPLWVP